MQFDQVLKQAKFEAQKYKYLAEIIHWDSINRQFRKNPSIINTTRNKNEPLNLVDALIRPRLFPSTAFDHISNLRLLNGSLESIWDHLDIRDKNSISSKICNLSGTEFWDMGIELWSAKKLIANNFKIKLEYPLEAPCKGKTPPDADIAILDSDNSPVWLIDCVCPTIQDYKELEFLPDEEPIPEPEKAVNWMISKIEGKFVTKFNPFLSHYSKSKFAILLSVIKAEDITLHLEKEELTRGLPIINNQGIQQRLNLGIVIRFQENNDVIETVTYFIFGPKNGITRAFR